MSSNSCIVKQYHITTPSFINCTCTVYRIASSTKWTVYCGNTDTVQMHAVQKATALHCRIGLAWIVSSDTVCTSLIFSQWGAHLYSASTASVPRLCKCPLKVYLQCKLQVTVSFTLIRSELQDTCRTLRDTHRALEDTQGHFWNPRGYS